MAKSRKNELVAGMFVVLCLAALLGIVVWLGAGSMFKRSHQQAVFFVNEEAGSTGLAVGNPVQITDRLVGRISEIRPGPNATMLYIADIEAADVTIHSDGSAIPSVGLVGTGKLIITSRGSTDKPLADEANPVLLGSGLDQAMANIAAASEIIRQIAQTAQQEFNAASGTALLGKVHQVMQELASAAGNIGQQVDAKNAGSLIAKVNASADDVNRLTSTLAGQVSTTNPAGLLAKVHRSTDDVNAMTADARPKVEKTLTAVQGAAEQVESISKKDVVAILSGLRQVTDKMLKISADLADVSDQAKSIVVMNRDKIDELIENMNLVSANLKATSKEVRRSPWRLLYRPEEKELHSQNIYDAARAFSAGAEKLDSALSRLDSLSKAKPAGVPSDDPELQNIRRQVEETFSNFTKAEQALWKELAK